MRPCTRGSPSSACAARRGPLRVRMAGSALGDSSGMWTATATAASRSLGSRLTRLMSDAIPPADAPTTITLHRSAGLVIAKCPLWWCGQSQQLRPSGEKRPVAVRRCVLQGAQVNRLSTQQSRRTQLSENEMTSAGRGGPGDALVLRTPKQRNHMVGFTHWHPAEAIQGRQTLRLGLLAGLAPMLGPLAALLALGCGAIPMRSAAAQSRYELSPFASRNGSLDGSPILVGAGLTAYGNSLGGILGMRFDGAYVIRSFAGGATATDTERGWVADADAVISPARFPVIGPLLGGFLPTVFSGFGAEGIRRSDGTGGQSLVTSYGAGVSRTIGGALSVETEARRRVPVSLDGS